MVGLFLTPCLPWDLLLKPYFAQALVYWLKNGCLHLDEGGPEIVRPCPALPICSVSFVGILARYRSVLSLPLTTCAVSRPSYDPPALLPVGPEPFHPASQGCSRFRRDSGGLSPSARWGDRFL